MDKTHLNSYPLYLALTRKPMFFGVPQSYFMINFLISNLIFLIVSIFSPLNGFLFSIAFFSTVYFFGWLGFKRDQDFLDIWRGFYFETTCFNQHFYHCVSYDAE